MGLTYDELSVFGRLRKSILFKPIYIYIYHIVFRCGPVSMFKELSL